MPAQVIANLSQLVVMTSSSLVDPLVARCLVGEIREQFFKTRAGCNAFSSEYLRIDRHIQKERVGGQTFDLGVLVAGDREIILSTE